MSDATPDSVPDSVRNLILGSIPGMGAVSTPAPVNEAKAPALPRLKSQPSSATTQSIKAQLELRGGASTTRETPVTPQLQRALLDESMKKADEFFSRLV